MRLPEYLFHITYPEHREIIDREGLKIGDNSDRIYLSASAQICREFLAGQTVIYKVLTEGLSSVKPEDDEYSLEWHSFERIPIQNLVAYITLADGEEVPVEWR